MSINDQTRTVRESSNGWMIQRIAKRLDDAMAARLAPHGLTLPSFAVMMTVLELGALTQTAIGKRFGLPAYTISRAIDSLEELGLVTRQPHAESRRAHMVHATEAGLALADTLHEIVRSVNANLTAPLEAQERAEFSNMLTRVLKAGS